MLTEVLILLIGVIIILVLAEIIIKNSIELANHFGLSGTFIGLTMLSLGTSIPEIITHIIGSVDILKNPASMNTLSALLIGTNIGSDIFQQNFILPVVGLIGTIVVIKKNLVAEVGALVLASLLVWMFALGGFINRVEGFILLVAYIGYVVYLKRSKISESYEIKNHLTRWGVTLSFILIVISFFIMALVAEEVLNASEILIETLPISASFFGIILLGVTSALPELATSTIAVLNEKKDISAGILIGSNITNPLFGIGLGAMISNYTVPDVIVLYDLPVKVITALLIFWFLTRNEKLNRWEGITMILLFLVYVFFRQLLYPVDF